MKSVDLSKSMHALTEEFPELIDVLKNLGFLGVANPVLRNTVGRVTTLPQGCQKMGKDLGEVIQALKDQGFEVKQ